MKNTPKSDLLSFCLRLLLLLCIFNFIHIIPRKDYRSLSDPSTTLKCHLVSLRHSNKVAVHELWKPGGKRFLRIYEKRLHEFTCLYCCVLLFLVLVLFVCLFCFADVVFFGTFVGGGQGESMQIRVFSCGINNLLHVHSQIFFLFCLWIYFFASSLKIHITMKSVLLQGLAYISVSF